jgi:hypothetical protein
MGQRVIEKCFPDLAAELKGCSYTVDVAACRERAATLLTKFPDETREV